VSNNQNTKNTARHRRPKQRRPFIRTGRFWALLATLIVGLMALYEASGRANATPADDYYTTLQNQGMTIWDYPLMLQQGTAVCELLYQNINPYLLLTSSAGYQPADAAAIITSAQNTLCPGTAVTGPPTMMTAA